MPYHPVSCCMYQWGLNMDPRRWSGSGNVTYGRQTQQTQYRPICGPSDDGAKSGRTVKRKTTSAKRHGVNDHDHDRQTNKQQTTILSSRRTTSRHMVVWVGQSSCNRTWQYSLGRLSGNGGSYSQGVYASNRACIGLVGVWNGCVVFDL